MKKMFMLELFQLMEKICIKNIGVKHRFEKKTPQLFFFKKPSIVPFNVSLKNDDKTF